MVNFTDMVLRAYALFISGSVYSGKAYDQVHDAVVVNANGLPSAGLALPPDC